MKTTSIGIENLCVPCHSFCRYCLLSSCGKATGVDYERGKQFATRLYDEARNMRPDLRVFYYIGYCMDDEHLLDYIQFSQETSSPSAEFLQLNGLHQRDEAETKDFVRAIAEAGIKEIDLTFYGTKEYHDRFAGRAGDFDYLLRILRFADEQGVRVHISVPIHKENCGQTDELLEFLGEEQNVSLFLPHSKGRGRSLDSLRLTTDDRDQLSSQVKVHLEKYQPESEWLKEVENEVPTSRMLTLSLKPDNIEMLETMSLDEIIKYLESLDEDYYKAVPSAQELAARYGNKNGNRLYRRFRDLHIEWQQRFLDESKLDVWDVNDETHHFSVRY